VKPPIDLKLPDPDLKAELRDDGQGGVLVVSAKRLAREVWVDFGSLDATLGDNAFDLLPGETRELRVDSQAGIDALRGALRVRSLAGATKGEGQP
jgi:beta-mannosidase